MVIEKELWGEIDQDLYLHKVEQFTKEFGKPQGVRRLAFRFGPNDAHHINTRIRITNGNAQIMQKIHNPERRTASEYSVDIRNDAREIISLFRTYQRILNHYPDVHFYLLRFENKIFEDKEFEIKLTHQFGNEDIYSFEVEAMKKGVDVLAKCKNLQLAPNLNATTNSFWVEYNKRANVDISSWGDQKLEEIVNGYL